MRLATLLPGLLAGLADAAPGGGRVLIFHKENGFVHASTPSAAAALADYLERRGLAADPTVDGGRFTPGNLARYQAVVFLNTNYRNGALLTEAQQADFEAYIRGGGGFVGIHSAVPLDGEWEEGQWPWFARLFGGRFQGHLPYRAGELVAETRHHPSTAALPERFEMWDEWYALREAPRPPIRLLASAAATFPAFPGDGGNLPMTWCQEFEGGRSWVTLPGHDVSAFRNPHFLTHLHGGILWAGGWDAETLPGPGRSLRWRAAWRRAGLLDADGRLRIGFTDGTRSRGAAGRLSAGPDVR